MNLLDDLFKDHYNQGFLTDRENIKPYKYWTKEKLQDEVNKYETRNEFWKKNVSAATTAKNKKLLDELFKNHNNNGYLTREEWIKNSYVIYIYELTKFNRAYIGLTNNILRRDREHLFNFKTSLNKYCKENNIPIPNYKILEKNLNPIEAINKEKYWIDLYKDNGWKLFNIAKPGSLGGNDIVWTKDKLYKLVKQFNTRNEFKKKASGAYSAAVKYKILDDLFKDHINKGLKYKERRFLSFDELQKEANKYLTRMDFQKNDPGSYTKARLNNILDKLFKNHPNQGFKINKNK